MASLGMLLYTSFRGVSPSLRWFSHLQVLKVAFTPALPTSVSVSGVALSFSLSFRLRQDSLHLSFLAGANRGISNMFQIKF